MCHREARGFGYCHGLRFADFPLYRFCSVRCQQLGAELAARNFGMIDKTDHETQAIRDARRPFAEAVTELGLMASFHGRSAAEIDQLIEAVVTGYVASMQRQCAPPETPGAIPNDPIPF